MQGYFVCVCLPVAFVWDGCCNFCLYVCMYVRAYILQTCYVFDIWSVYFCFLYVCVGDSFVYMSGWQFYMYLWLTCEMLQCVVLRVCARARFFWVRACMCVYRALDYSCFFSWQACVVDDCVTARACMSVRFTCIYVCLYVCICVSSPCACMFMCNFLCICIHFVYVRMNPCTCVSPVRCVNVHMHVCVVLCIYVFICLFVCMNASVWFCSHARYMCTYASLCTSTHAFAGMCMHMFICKHVAMCVCTLRVCIPAYMYVSHTCIVHIVCSQKMFIQLWMFIFRIQCSFSKSNVHFQNPMFIFRIQCSLWQSDVQNAQRNSMLGIASRPMTMSLIINVNGIDSSYYACC
jgi:hypothetical protein